MRGATSFVFSLSTALMLLIPAAAATAPQWERSYASTDLIVETRPHPGSDIREVRAQGLMPVPPHVVRAVISDVARYPEFMPYVTEARVLSRSNEGTITYQRISFGVFSVLGVGDRDYILRNVERVIPAPDGRVTYKRIWNATRGDDPPPQPSVIRLTLVRGFWQLSPADDAGTQTRVVYCIFSNPGGSLPIWAINHGNTIAVPKVFDAVRRTAHEPRYRSTPMPDPAQLMAAMAHPTESDDTLCGDR